MSRLLLRWVRAAGRFWVDFFLGDSLILLPATLGILGLAVALRHDRAAAVFAVPVAVAMLIAVTAFLGRRRPGPVVQQRPPGQSDGGR